MPTTSCEYRQLKSSLTLFEDKGKIKMNTDNVKVIAILGKVLNEDGTPKDQLVKRCQLAAEMTRSDPSALIVPSGGDPRNIGITEAAVMSRILNEHGIGSHRIFLDDSCPRTPVRMPTTHSSWLKRGATWTKMSRLPLSHPGTTCQGHLGFSGLLLRQCR